MKLFEPLSLIVGVLMVGLVRLQIQVAISTIKALFRSELTEDELDRLIEQLARRGVIKIADGKIQYDLPT